MEDFALFKVGIIPTPHIAILTKHTDIELSYSRMGLELTYPLRLQILDDKTEISILPNWPVYSLNVFILLCPV